MLTGKHLAVHIERALLQRRLLGFRVPGANWVSTRMDCQLRVRHFRRNRCLSFVTHLTYTHPGGGTEDGGFIGSSPRKGQSTFLRIHH